MDYIKLLQRLQDELASFDYVAEACCSPEKEEFDTLMNRYIKLNSLVKRAYEMVKDKFPDHPTVKWAEDRVLADYILLAPTFEGRHDYAM